MTQKGWIHVFAAIDPENREIVNFHLSEHRELADAWIFLRKCVECCENEPLLVTDGGPEPPLDVVPLAPADDLVFQSHPFRSPRIPRTLKDRIRNFGVYFPTKGTEMVENLMNALCHWYNRSRNHMTLGKPPDGTEHGFKRWIETLN